MLPERKCMSSRQKQEVKPVAEANVRPRDVTAWLEDAIADAERRGLPELRPLLETLAQATTALRAADFDEDASGAEGERD